MSTLLGTTLGPYRLLDQIGQGGMSTVYKAYRQGTNRLVAIKVLSETWGGDATIAARFRRETQLLISLEHRSIVPVYEVCEHETYLCLVMRYLQAGTARDILRRGPLPVADAARLIIEIADALDYAHEHNIIHRDVKPNNILIDKQGHAYLTDFGMAKSVQTSMELTRSGDSLGTPAYMAPEQSLGWAVTPQTDVYALGVTLYELVTGRVPFENELPVAQAMMHVQSTPPPPRAFNPALSERVEAVILKAMAKNPFDRFRSAGEFARAFNLAVLDEAPTQPLLLPALAGAVAASKGAEEVTPDLRRDIQRHERRDRWQRWRRPIFSLGFGLLVLALILSWGWAGNEIFEGRAASAKTATAITGLLQALNSAQTLVAAGGGHELEGTVQYLQTQIATDLGQSATGGSPPMSSAEPSRTPNRSFTVTSLSPQATHTLSPTTFGIATTTYTPTWAPPAPTETPNPPSPTVFIAPSATLTEPPPTVKNCNSNPHSNNYCTPTPTAPP